MPKFLNPFKTDKDFQNDFEEWLRDRYYSNTIDEPDYYDIARESKY